MDTASFDKNSPIWRDPRAVALLLAATLTVMAAATISPALPGLRLQFPLTDTNDFLIRLLVPAPALTVVLSAPFCGRIADRKGRRGILLGGVALYATAGSMGLFLSDLTLLLVSRLILGLALAMIMTSQSALLGDYFSGDKLRAVSGAQVSARNLGGLVFILLAGFLAEIAPRLTFAVYALPFLLCPFLARVITEPRQAAASTQTPESVPTHSHWQRTVRLLALGQVVVTAIFFTMPTQLPFFLEYRGYASPAITGTSLGAMMLAGGMTALSYSRLRGACSDAGVWAIAFCLMAAGFLSLIGAGGLAPVLLGTAAIGAGYSLAVPGFITLSLAATPAHRRGWTGAQLTMAAFLGQFLSPFFSMSAIKLWGWEASGLSVGLGLIGAAAIAVILGKRPYRVQ